MPNSKTFTIKNKVIHLTHKELHVLHMLATNLNNNISYDKLKEYVWKNQEVSNSTIRDTVSRLKRKAVDLNIQTIIGFGYVLKPHTI